MTKEKEVIEQDDHSESVQDHTDEKPKKRGRRSLRSSKTQKLEEKNEELKLQLEELKDKHMRLFAEFDNFKKRNIKERLELMRTAAQNTLTAILPVLDDFDRAKMSADDETTEEYFSEGVVLLYDKLYKILDQQGLKPMESNGETFDPEVHEAITEIPAPSEDMKGKVMDTIEKGYLLEDKIIRYAKVVVGK